MKNDDEQIEVYNAQSNQDETVSVVIKSDEEWRSFLSPEQFEVTRLHGTEAAFTGEYWDLKEDGAL